MPSIIVTTDLSEESRRAFIPARDLARRLGLEITLLSVLEDLLFEPVVGGLLTVAPDRTQLQHDHRKELDRCAKLFGTDVRVHAVMIEGTDVPRAIAQHVNQAKPEFVAMATHGRTGLRRLLLGSVAEQVVRMVHVPVVLYPPLG